jgi:Spy/CpxP family protein refolding chaperone
MRESKKQFLIAMGVLAMVGLLAVPVLAITQQDTSQGNAATEPSAADAAGMPPGAHFAMHRMVHQLNLTDDQKTAAKQLFQDLKTKLAPFHQTQQQLHTQLEAALAAPQPDATAVGQIAIQMHQNRAQMKPVIDAFHQQFQALLNPDQLAKYKQMLAAHPFFGHFRGGPAS